VTVILIVLVVVFLAFAGIWTDLLWYRSVGFSSVYTKRITTSVLLFFGGALIMMIVVGANIVTAYRLRPAFRPPSPEQQGLDRYRSVLDPHRRAVLATLLVVIGLFTGSSTGGQWQIWLAFLNRQPFGIKDPQFHKDISFFVFTYPLLRSVLSFLFGAVVCALLYNGPESVALQGAFSFALGAAFSGTIFVNLAGYHVRSVAGDLAGRASGLFVTSLFAAATVAGYAFGWLVKLAGWTEAGNVQLVLLCMAGAAVSLMLQPALMAKPGA